MHFLARTLCLLSSVALAGEPSALAPSAFSYVRAARAVPSLETDGPDEKRGDVTIHSVRLNGPERMGVKGFLVEPPGAGPFAGILFVHWLGDPQTSNRSEFLREAVGLAQRGVVSLLVDGMWAAPEWFEQGRKPQTDFSDAIAQVKSLQHAMDVLLARPNVDAKRVAFVGHDFGAMYGVLMGAAEPRAKTYVLLAPTATFHEWFLLSKQQPRDVRAYVQAMAPLDITRYLGKLKASVFLQFAKKDKFVALDRVKLLSESAVEPKRVAVYENVDHSMSAKDGLNERYRWLSRELSLGEGQ